MTRPWVSPQEVIAYTEIQAVKDRNTTKLAVDISRAEEYVINYTHNDFSADIYSARIPDAVKTAIIMLAELYAKQAIIDAKQADFVVKKNGAKSETYDDYSYTIGDGSSAEMGIDSLDLSSLLDAYILTQATGKFYFRMRKL
ncbi:MAG: DUF3199 family protein [Lachnospiraceae bacterium]|nr:DUF3199 family protein [Lachnospiraceae bacterium]